MDQRVDQTEPLRSPLIQILGQDGIRVDNDSKKSIVELERRDVFEEVKKQLWLAGPLVSAGLLNFCIQIISVMFVGHLGELPLAGASMATSFASVTGISLLVSVFVVLPYCFYLWISKFPCIKLDSLFYVVGYMRNGNFMVFSNLFAMKLKIVSDVLT